MDGEKKCTGLCGLTKPIDCFSTKGAKRRHSQCKECRNAKHLADVAPARKYYANRKERILAGVRTRRARYRLEALVRYSQDPPSCLCCGEHRLKFLTLDHIDGGGSQHRRELSKSKTNSRSPGGLAVYYWLRKNDYPSGFRVLCFNCNCAIGCWGTCPHEEERAGT